MVEPPLAGSVSLNSQEELAGNQLSRRRDFSFLLGFGKKEESSGIICREGLHSLQAEH
jgi:hypothetical protein